MMYRGTLYLLDANVLIDAQRDYYPRERIPEFWDWLAHQGSLGAVKIPDEILRKLVDVSDDLATWLKQHANVLRLEEEMPTAYWRKVLKRGYACDLQEDELDLVSEDSQLIAYALASSDNRRVVTTEHSKPRRERANRHIPDVCETLRIKCCNTFEMMDELGFTTKWDRR